MDQTITEKAAATAAINSHRHNRHHRRGKPPEDFSTNNFALDRKIKEAMAGMPASVQWSLMEFSDDDKELISDFILHYSDYGNGRPMKPGTKKIYLDALHLLSKYVVGKRNGGKYKALHEFTWDDFFAKDEPKGYLESLKPGRAYNNNDEDGEQSDEKWINSSNNNSNYNIRTRIRKFRTPKKLKILFTSDSTVIER